MAPTSPAPGAPGPNQDGMLLRLPVASIRRISWVVVAVLIVATFAVQVVRETSGANTIVNLLDSDQKLNVPSAAKIILLLASTGLFGLLGLAQAERGPRIRWIGMSGIFALLTLDEMIYFHQRLSDLLHESFETHGPLRFAWVAIYLPLVVVIAIVYLPFWRKLPSRFRTELLVAAILFAGGSGGIELVKSALYEDDRWTFTYGIVASISDSLELIGLALLATVLLRELAAAAGRVTVTFTDH